MMLNLIMFTRERELQELTGLDHDNLIAYGFDLDDWSVGFCSDVKLTEYKYYQENGQLEYYTKPICGSDWLIDRLDSWGTGYRHTEYGGKHYYMAYHS